MRCLSLRCSHELALPSLSCGRLLAAQILAQLEQCKNFPDFNNYLAFIFAQGESLPIEVWSCHAGSLARSCPSYPN